MLFCLIVNTTRIRTTKQSIVVENHMTMIEDKNRKKNSALLLLLDQIINEMEDEIFLR